MAKKKYQLECHDCDAITTIIIDDSIVDLTEDDIKYCPFCGSTENISIEN